MWNLRTAFGPVKIARLVDRDRVLCPVQGRDVNVDGCGSCSFVDAVIQDAEGVLSEIKCQIPVRALIRVSTDI